MTDTEWMTPPERDALTGSETFVGLPATVVDFWRFALPNLMMNNARGYLAEFLVARAVGSQAPRVEWDSYDVLAPDGTKIEVKSAAYLQAWQQRSLSTIRFTGLTGRAWAPAGGFREAAEYNADVYVFALHTATDHREYEPLDVAQWEFYVVPRAELTRLGQQSLGLASLRRLAPRTAFDGLADAIAEAATAHGAGRPPG